MPFLEGMVRTTSDQAAWLGPKASQLRDSAGWFRTSLI